MEVSPEPSAPPGAPAVPARLQFAAGVSWRALVVLALVAVLLFVFWHLRAVAVPLFVALLFSTLLLPLTNRLVALRVPRALAVLIAILVFIGALALTVTLIVGSIVGEAGQIADLVSTGVAKVSGWARDHNGPLSFDRGEVRKVLSGLGPDLQHLGGGLLAKAAAETSAALTVVVGFVMSIAFLVYLLADAPGLRRWVVAQASDEHRPVVERTLDQGWATLSGYVRGTIVVAVFDTVFIGIAVYALGLPIPGTLLALTFFAAFIPIVGAWVAGLIVILVALADHGLDAALVMVGVQVAVHGVESVWVAPVTYRHTVRLHPIATLAAVTAGAALMGVLGALIAVPVVAFLWVVFRTTRHDWLVRDAAPGGAPAPT